MTAEEAIQKGNAFVLLERGVEGAPASVRRVDRQGKQRYWSLIYGAELFFPEDIAEGTVIDGGEYIVRIDDQSGEVSLFVPPG